MFKVECDYCGKEIKDNNYRITISGFEDGDSHHELCSNCRERLKNSIAWLTEHQI